MQKDSKKNVFTEFEDTRLTLVLNRDPGTDWANSAVLRIQKYSNPVEGQSLRLGPEIPLESKDKGIELAMRILELVQQMP